MRPISRLPVTELFAQPARFSQLIDVRSPAEYAEDRITGAINLWALDDQERADVGRLYKQVNPFEARKRGASLVCANVARHIADQLLSADRDYRPLLYCWRGGQRSGSFALVLAQIGWEVTVLEGGYKAYRHWVLARLKDLPGRFRFVVIGGYTGSGKTELLGEIARQGGQTLDLEACARHRGSLLGADPAEPPAEQKAFDSALIDRLRQLDPDRPVFVESESAKIGKAYQPAALWQNLGRSDYFQLDVPAEVRAGFILSRYPNWTQAPEALLARLQRLKQRVGGERLADWERLIATGQWQRLVADLLVGHYDPAYDQSRQSRFASPVGACPHNPLDPSACAATAAHLLHRFGS